MPQTYPLIPGTWTLIKESWTLIKKLWRKFLLLQLVQVVASALFAVFALPVLGGAISWVVLSGPSALLGTGVFGALLFFGLLIFSLIISILVYIATFELAKNQSAALGIWTRVWDARKKFWGLLWVMILATLATLVGYVVFIIPGIVIGIWLTQSTIVFIYEGTRGTAALKRSRELVRGFWWTVFARMLVFALVFVGARLLLTIPESLISAKIHPLARTIYQMAVNSIVTIVGVVFAYKLYSALKEVKEKDAGATDLMPTAKKVGLAIFPAVIVAFLLFGLMGARTLIRFTKGTGGLNANRDQQTKLEDFLREMESEERGLEAGGNINFNYQ